MKNTKELKSKGYFVEFKKRHSDSQGYDLYLMVKTGDSYFENGFS